jgi:hypothetical protein
MLRELLWAMSALGAMLIWYLSKTWDQGPLMEELLSVETLWTFAKAYGLVLLVRIAFWTLRAAAKALN